MSNTNFVFALFIFVLIAIGIITNASSKEVQNSSKLMGPYQLYCDSELGVEYWIHRGNGRISPRYNADGTLSLCQTNN